MSGSVTFIVTTENGARHCGTVLETVKLAKRPADEVVVLTRSDQVHEINVADQSWFRVVGIPDASVFRLRAQIPAVSQKEWLIVLEEHSLVTAATLDSIRATIETRPDIEMVAFLGKNLTSISPWGWANFLHTFALVWAPIKKPPPFSPVTSAVVRRSALGTDGALRDIEWELVVIPRIFARGRVAYSNEIYVDHVKPLAAISCIVLSFHNARAGAGLSRGIGRSVKSILKEGWYTFLQRPGMLIRAIAQRRSELPAGMQLRLHFVGLAHLCGNVVGAFFGPGQSPHRLD